MKYLVIEIRKKTVLFFNVPYRVCEMRGGRSRVKSRIFIFAKRQVPRPRVSRRLRA